MDVRCSFAGLAQTEEAEEYVCPKCGKATINESGLCNSCYDKWELERECSILTGDD